MVWVAIVEAVALVAVVSVFARALLSLQRQQARREDLLIAQLLHATGNAWTPPPIDEWQAKLERSREERRDYERSWTPTPEQRPND